MTSSTTEKPTILLITGAWHTPKYFQTITKQLESQGYPTLSPQLLSSKPNGPQANMHDDAAAIQKELTRLVDAEGKKVVVFMHSYGGLVGTEAVTEELAYGKRQSAGKAGGVISLFYCTAFMVAPGMTLLNACGDAYPPWNKLDTPSKGLLIPETTEYVFYNDLPADVQARCASEVIPQWMVTFHTPLSRASYLYVPSTYFLCEEDHAIPIQGQEAMIKLAETAGATVRQVRSTASHSPMMSQPDMLVREIIAAAQAASA